MKQTAVSGRTSELNAETRRAQVDANREGIASVILRALCASALSFVFVTHTLGAATNDLTSLLQRGLFEEEANRNLDAAIASYDALARQFDKNRQIAATAIFRLGECYRKLGRTNDAIQHYERIVRDFSDQPTLVTLSRQNLAGMGKPLQQESAPAQSSAWTRAAEEAAAEAATLKVQIDALRALPKSEWRSAIRQFHTTERLERLQEALNEAEEKQRQTALNYDSDHPLFKVTVANLKASHEKLDEEMEAIFRGLELKHKIAAERAKVLQGQSGTAALRKDEPQPILDEEEKEIRRLQAMIQNSPDLINAVTGDDSSTPLARAANKGQLRVMRFLLENGAEVDRRSPWGTPLHHATIAGHKSAAELLLKAGAKVSASNDEGDSPLHLAVRHGYQGVTETLLHSKADVNARNRRGETPLHTAAGNGRATVLEMLIAAGANVNAQNNDGITALSHSIYKGQQECAELLLKVKADPNAGTVNAPLLVAIWSKNLELAGRLLEAGADPNRLGRVNWHLDFEGSSYPQGTQILPLHLALVQRNDALAELLLKWKANPNATRPDGMPLLFSAVPDVTLMGPLLEAGADPDARDKHFTSPLSHATYARDASAVELLLRYKADVRAKGHSGYTALHSAIYNGSRRVLEVLLAAGADPNARSDEGKTPLDLAKELVNPSMGLRPVVLNNQLPPDAMKPEEIVALLRQHGAVDDLPDFNSIRVTRQGMSRPKVVFQADPAVSNRFTLLETLLRFYGEQRRGYGFPPIPLPVDPERLVFPDLKRIIVHRPSRGGKGEQTIAVNLLNATNGIDCSRDIFLEFGEVVEVPVREYGLREPRVDLTPEQWRTAAECLKAEVQVTVRNQSRTVKLNAADAFLRTTLQAPEVQSLLLSSSDLSRVKVTRRDAASGQTQEWLVNCDPNRPSSVTPGDASLSAGSVTYQWYAGGQNAAGSTITNKPSAIDLWLRNGDAIEIPEK